MTARQDLDRCLRRFVDHVLAGEDEQARVAFVDAEAFMPSPVEVRDEGRAWVFAEQLLTANLPDGLSDRAAQASLAALRGRGGRR